MCWEASTNSARVRFVKAFDAIVPELGFDAAEAALNPLGRDEGVDSESWLGSAGW